MGNWTAAMALLFGLLTGGEAVARAPVRIVAAENFYGDVAAQIGGTAVAVTSVLDNPSQDPHLFEASPSVARAVAAADIVIYNGVSYDPWMPRLIAAAHRDGQRVIVAASLIGAREGANPHIWYDPETMPAVAGALLEALVAVDPEHAAQYRQRREDFARGFQPVLERIAAMRARLAGAAVTATEPVAGYLFAALGLRVRNEAFARAVMNETEPAASQVAAFENDLKNHRVSLLAYNSQASGPIAERMAGLARAAGVRVVAMSETEPAGTSYQRWMLDALDAIDQAMAR